MALRPDGKDWVIKEQIIEDPVSELTFKFESIPGDTDCPYKLTIYGNLPFGNRDLLFSHDGEFAASGTAIGGVCRATWIKEEK